MLSKKLNLDKLLADKNFIESDRRYFASELFEFLDGLDPQIKNAIEKYAASEKNEDSARLIEVEKKLIQELQQNYKKIRDYYSEHKIALPTITIRNLDTNQPDSFTLEECFGQQEQVYQLIHTLEYLLSSLMNANIPAKKIQNFIQKNTPFPLKKATSQQLTSAHVMLKNYIKQKKIHNKTLTTLTQEFPEYGKQDKVCENLLKITNLSHTIKILLDPSLGSAYHIDLVKQFAHLNEDGVITRLELSFFNTWDSQQKIFDRLKVSKIWHSWDQLKQFQQLYTNFELDQLDALEKKDFLQELLIYDNFQKIMRIATGKEVQYMDELKKAKQMIVKFIQSLPTINVQDQIKSTPNKRIFPKKSVTATIDTNGTITLSSDNKEDLPFKKYESKNGKSQEINRNKLLAILLSNPSGLSKNELLAQLKSDTETIRRARRGINETVRDKWGFEKKYIERESSGRLRINDDDYATIIHQA